MYPTRPVYTQLNRSKMALMDRPEDAYLSVEQVAAYLGVSKDTVYTWRTLKGMPAHRLGRLWKFKKDEVDSWVKSGGAAAHRQTDSSKEQDR